MVELSAFPAVGIGLRQSNVRQDAVSELAGDVIQAYRSIVEGWDERVDGGPRIGGPVHVPDMNLVERSLANAEHQGALLLQADVRCALDEMGAAAVGNATQGADAAGNNHHSVSWIGAAGDIGADIGVDLLANFIAVCADDLGDEVVAPLEVQFFGHYTEPAIGRDEIHGLNAVVSFDSEQEMFQEQRTTRASGGNRQVVRWNGRQTELPDNCEDRNSAGRKSSSRKQARDATNE